MPTSRPANEARAVDAPTIINVSIVASRRMVSVMGLYDWKNSTTALNTTQAPPLLPVVPVKTERLCQSAHYPHPFLPSAPQRGCPSFDRCGQRGCSHLRYVPAPA